MRSFFKWIVLVTLAGGLSACGGQKGAKLQKNVIPADKTLFQNGTDFLAKSQYTQARLAFQTLIRTYPGSELEAEAYFSMGDSFLREGGTENLLLAEDQFRNFIIFFPTNPKAPDAEMKIISILMSQMRAPDRDQKETERAEAEIQKFMTLYPNNDFIPIVKQYLDEVRESLALHDLSIGDFYAERNNFGGASSRYQSILDNYPKFSRMDEVAFKQAQAQLQIAELFKKMENAAEAAAMEKQAIENLNRISSAYPFSKYFEDAKAELTRLGKPVPAIDSDLAAKNQALVKQPPPFSPLRPLIDLANAMGFISAPNRYDEAKKIVAETKAAAEAAAAAQSGTKAADPKINLGTIEKGPDGKPVTNSKVTTTQTDKTVKKDEKKTVDPIKK
jgi:outer membrane assembly lipoprotein YfiO